MTTATLSRQTLTGDAAVAEGDRVLTDGKRRLNPALYGPALVEAARLVESAFAGDRYQMLKLQEALTTSDFRILFSELLDRQLLARYQDITPTWQRIASRTVVRNFKPKRMSEITGGRQPLDRVAELAPYPARSLAEGEYALTVGKLGGRYAWSWEMFVNDELDVIRQLPENLAIAARDTEQLLVSGMLATPAGPNPGFFTTGDANRVGNIVAGNPALTTDSLAGALTRISTQVDDDNRPIVVTAATLVVPPALEIQARRIVGATEIRTEVNGQTIVSSNYLAGVVEVVVDPWFTAIDKSASAATTWYLVPSANTPRPALVLGFLAGHETPDLRVKADTGVRVGGGAIPAEEGDFDEDGIQYRVRHVLGGTTLDPRATAVSKGTGAA